MYRYAPNAFSRDILGSVNDPCQKRILSEIADPNGASKIFIASCHGIGKTHMAGKALLHMGATGGRCRIPCTAPKEDTLLRKLWPEIHKILGGADPLMRQVAKWSNTRVTFYGTPGWEALAETARDPEGLAGHHEERVLFIVEEATGVGDEFYPVIEGALTTAGSKLVCITNFTRTTGYFARMFRNGGDDVKLFRVAWNPRGIEEDEPKETHRPYFERSGGGAEVETWYSDRPDGDWARSIIEREGWGSTICRVRVRGLPPLADDDSLVPAKLIWDAYGRSADPDLGYVPPLVWSWDVAGAGRDRSVIAARRGWHVESIVEDSEPNTALAAQSLIEALIAEEPDQVNVDAYGVGDGPLAVMRAQGYAVDAVYVGTPPEGLNDQGQPLKDEFANERAWFYWQLRDDFRKGRISLDESIPEETIERLVEELEATRWKHSVNGKIQIVSKDEIKKDIKRSPDLADALMLHYARAEAGTPAAALGRARSADADW